MGKILGMYMEVSPTVATLFALLVVVLIISIGAIRWQEKCRGECFCGGKDQHCMCDGNEKFVPMLPL